MQDRWSLPVVDIYWTNATTLCTLAAFLWRGKWLGSAAKRSVRYGELLDELETNLTEIKTLYD